MEGARKGQTKRGDGGREKGLEEERRWREGERVRRRKRENERRAEVKGKGIICEKESFNTRQSLSLHTLQPSERIASGYFHYLLTVDKQQSGTHRKWPSHAFLKLVKVTLVVSCCWGLGMEN